MYLAKGALPRAMRSRMSAVKNVFVVGSMGTWVILRQGSCSTIDAASGSQRILNSRRGAFAYSAAKALFEGRGLKLPPMKTNSFARLLTSGSSRAASARLVKGPAAMIVTWPGWRCSSRIRQFAAVSAAALMCGAPAGDGGTRYGSGGY